MDGAFKLNGLLGLLIAVVILLASLFVGGKMAIETQVAASQDGYTLDASKLKMFNDGKKRQDFVK